MLGLSDGAWGFFGVLVVQLAGILLLIIRLGRTQRDVAQVNRAVNHVAAGEPTLVQRVALLEQQQSRHREWTHRAMCVIAHQLGVALDPIDPDPKGTP
jgi:hypothetical protein